jgi:geranylgeranyl pyrophosphate synthase
MLYMEATDEAGRERVRRVIEGNSHSADLTAEVLRDIVSSGVLERAHDVAVEYVEEAKASLDGCPDGPARKALYEVADFVVARSY